MKNWSGNNTARNHDYASRCLYHITLMKAKDVANFGKLAGDFRLPYGTPGPSYISASPVGRAIKSALKTIAEIHPSLKLYQYALMPDHLHMVISVEERLDEALGRKLARFKRKAAEFAGIERLFELGFNDQILYKSRNLDTIFKYLRENPYRLAARRANPDYFNKINTITIGNHQFSAFGNMHLLDNPFKEQVVVHRKDTQKDREKNSDR